MQKKITKGILGGLIAGVFFGIMMQMMTAPASEGMRMPMMAMVAKVVRSESLLVGWIYHLINSAAIGAIFGWPLGSRVHSYNSGFGWGALYGVVWWILGGLILMPIFLGMPAFAPLIMEPMRTVALGSLMGHMIYGLILGGSYVALTHRTDHRIMPLDQQKNLRLKSLCCNTTRNGFNRRSAF